ncbi:MAG: hypothetical protein CL908_20910 [Deltaproteobacteria bacterium]|nr:hypothetical protein [Deltaproteobacteria bacterium]
MTCAPATRFLLSVLLLIALFPAGSEADESNAGTWIPSFAVNTGLRALEYDEASVTSARGTFDSEGVRVFGYLGANVQLMTPVLIDRYGKPRLFVRVGAATSFDQEERVLNEFAPGQIVIVDPEGAIQGIQGQGSGTGVKTEPPTVTAGIGLDFAFEVFERRIHVKPSLDWIWEEERVKTVLGIAEDLGGNPTLCPCRTAFAHGTNTEPFHGLGPGIELELESGRLGPFMTGIYLHGQAYHVFDRKVSVRADAVWDDLSGTVSVQSGYERRPWDYRVGVGMRFHWLPD